MNVTNKKDLKILVLNRNLLSLYIEKGLQSRRCVLIKEEWAKAFGLTIQEVVNKRPKGTQVVYQCGYYDHKKDVWTGTHGVWIEK